MKAYAKFFIAMKIALIIQFILIVFKKQTKSSKIYILTEIVFKTSLFLFIEWFTFNNNFHIEVEDNLIISFGGAILFYDAMFNDLPRLIDEINKDKSKHIPEWIRSLINYFGFGIKTVKSYGDRN